MRTVRDLKAAPAQIPISEILTVFVVLKDIEPISSGEIELNV